MLVVTWNDGTYYATIADPEHVTCKDRQGYGESLISMADAIEKAVSDFYSTGLRTDDLFGYPKEKWSA